MDWLFVFQCTFKCFHEISSSLVFSLGIQPWEESYTDMAKAMGIDPLVSN